MNWNNGYTARYYASVVDPSSWRDVDQLDILSGSVNRSTDGLMESADLLCRKFDPDKEIWLRVYIDTRQAGKSAHTPIFTGLAVSPERDIDGNITEYPLQCYSVLQPADDVLLQRGWYAPVEANGAELIKRLLSVSPAPIVIDGISKPLSQAIIAEDRETNLTMAYKILTAIDWRLRIQGDGTIVICPKATETSASFDAIENDSIEPKMNYKRDWFKCPNVFRAAQGDTTAVARDDDPNSPLSTVTRGREVWAEESSANLNRGEGIAEYARRRLKEEQAVGVSVSYNRRYNPDLLVGDIVRLNYPRQKVVGEFRIESQTIELSYGATTSEEVIRA